MIDWTPYQLGTVLKPRSLQTLEGLGDRLRFVAFAERQAAVAFREAAERFGEAPAELREAWRWIALEEEKHEAWLLERLVALGQRVNERAVALDLYRSFAECCGYAEFAAYMAGAEQRGQVAGERFGDVLRDRDPLTAAVFARIALEEREHVALAQAALKKAL